MTQSHQWTGAGRTETGHVRASNQDALALLNDCGVWMVADGMGGHPAGDVAAYTAIAVATERARERAAWLREHSGAAAEFMADLVTSANRQIHELILAKPSLKGMGTTLVALAMTSSPTSVAHIAHLGDSRAYLLRAGTLVQLTKDHSLLARLTELDHPLLNDPSFGMPRNYLYRSLGQEDEAPPDMMEFPIAPGDRLMICSDGLWDELDDATIQRCITSTDDPAECANHLVRLANASGGHDNSTAVVVFVEAMRDDPATEFTPEQIDAILRASGALDEEGEGEGEGESNGS